MPESMSNITTNIILKVIRLEYHSYEFLLWNIVQLKTNTYIYALTLTPMNTRSQLYTYEHLQHIEPTNLEIDEVIIGTSLSTSKQ